MWPWLFGGLFAANSATKLAENSKNKAAQEAAETFRGIATVVFIVLFILIVMFFKAFM